MIKSGNTWYSLILSLGFLFPVAAFCQQQPILLHNRRELFVDDFLLDKQDNTCLRLGTPVSAGKCIEYNEPWEGNAATYVSIIHDGTAFRMYYRGTGTPQPVICYAESEDGTHWRKPKLGIFEINGSKENNVVMVNNPQQSTHNLSVFYDSRPACRPKKDSKQ
jgi:hypothetical protein